VEHKDIDQLELNLRADTPTSLYPAIKEFVESMQIWLQSGNLDPPNELAHELIQSLFENIFCVKWPPEVEILPREMGHPRWAQIEILSAKNGWAHGVYVFGYKRVGPSTGI
jgi:hypothetical protein